jgi:hypothetical protein
MLYPQPGIFMKNEQRLTLFGQTKPSGIYLIELRRQVAQQRGFRRAQSEWLSNVAQYINESQSSESPLGAGKNQSAE